MIEPRRKSKVASYLARAISASVITVACFPQEGRAQANARGQSGQSLRDQVTDREKATMLEARAAVLRQRIEELKREERRMNDDADYTSAILRVGAVADRKKLEAKLYELGAGTMRAIAERERALDSLRSVDDRLRYLRRLQALELEIKRLREAEGEETKSLRRLEAEWEAQRSRVSQSIVMAAVLQEALELTANPRIALGDVARSRDEAVGLDINDLVRADDAKLQTAAKSASKSKEEAEMARTEARRHLDRESAVKMKIVELQSRIALAKMKLDVLEASRQSWDHD
jgi:hypothetical protein